RQHSQAELERITRRFTHALGSNIGPEYDIPAPDVGTNGQIMVWMMDTYMNVVGFNDKNANRRVVTGKTLASGGSHGRESATGPTETAAAPILHDKNIDLIPDILANSGGVVVSYYEWLQNKRSERWDLEEVEERLAKRMKRTYLQVSEYASAKKCDWRMAAMGIALERIGRAYAERGIFP